MKLKTTKLACLLKGVAIPALSVLLFCLSPEKGSAQQCSYNNPIIKGNFPDPWVMQKDGWYYWCKQDNGNSLTVERSKGQLPGIAPTEGWTQAWSHDNNVAEAVWAPELHFFNNKWYIYASGDRDGAPGLQNLDMFVLEADNWNGPYKFLGFINTWDFRPEWCIDPDILIHPVSGKPYLTWSQWEGGMQCIYIGEMDSPIHLKNAVKLSQPDFDWEKKPNNDLVNEGPEFLVKNNTLHIAYSASQCHSRYYKLGLLTANLNSNLTDKASWSKSTVPVFSEAQGAWGPGHNCFVKSPDGTQDWIIYHAHTDGAWENAVERGDRSIFAQAFTWNGDYPVFGSPINGGPINCPSTDGGVHTPFNNTPASIPGIVQAENYDIGKNGSAYYDTEDANLGTQYRNDGADVETCAEGGFNIAFTNNNEWIKYTVNVSQAGRYKIDFRVASFINGAAIHLEVDGVDKTGIINIPNTGGWQAWTNVQKTIVLPSGQHVLTLFFNQGGVNVNHMTFTKDFKDGIGTGILGTYYNGMNFEKKILTRLDDKIDFNWEANSPDPLINNDGFSARWEGFIEPRYSEEYTFLINSDNGRRLWIDDVLIVDKWLADWGITYSGKANLMAGTKHKIKMEYFEDNGGANAHLDWASASQPQEVVPKSQFYPSSVITGMEEVNGNILVDIYPNPTSNLLTVTSEKGIEEVSISDLQGKTIYQAKVFATQSHTFSLKEFISEGTYILSVKTATGIRFKKIIVN